MKIIFMGNPDFAVPSLEILAASQHRILSVVTNPPKNIGRGRPLRHSPVGDKARELGLPLLPVDSLQDESLPAKLQELNPDLFVVVAYRILPRSILAIPARGAVNLHASMLPKYRGAAPIQWALINGDSETGVTTFLIDPKVDTGKILLQEKTAISPEDDFGSLSRRLSTIGAGLLSKTVDQLEAGAVIPQFQDHSQATSAPKITPDFCRIDWTRPAPAIRNLVRALSPAPGAFTQLSGWRIKIFRTRLGMEKPPPGFSPGQVIRVTRQDLVIQTGSGPLDILECQIEGKRRMPVPEFLRGMPVRQGVLLGK